MSQITTEKIVRGLANLEQMKRDIKSVVDAVLDQVKKHWPMDACGKPAATRVYGSRSCCWEIVRSTTRPWPLDGHDYVIHCRVANPTGESGTFIVYSTVNHKFYHTKYVEVVYDALQILIDEVIKDFPAIAEEIEPVVMVADKF